MGTPQIEPVIARVQVPPGMLGPHAVTFEVRCFVVAGPSGVVIVDTGPPGSVGLIGEALARVGAAWSDVTDIVLTHRHFDHVGGLSETAGVASGATLWAGADDAAEIPAAGGRLRPLADGQKVGDLQILDTPGHTPGHVSLLHEDGGILLIGDLVGSVEGALAFGPASFTADPALNRRSLQRVADLRPARILYSHGGEVPDPGRAIRQLLDGP